MIDLSVMIAIPSYSGMLPVQLVASLISTLSELDQLDVPHDYVFLHGNSLAHHARSQVGHAFLASGYSRLFMIDGDIVWAAQDFVRMLKLSAHMDVVCAAYVQKQDRLSVSLRMASDAKLNAHGCLPIHGAGLGFTVVQRRVMTTLAERVPHVAFQRGEKPMPYLFRCAAEGGEAGGEDTLFFADVRAMGFGVYLDPRTKLGHVGSKVYVGDIQAALALSKQ